MVVYHQSCGCVAYKNVEGERMFLILHYPNGHWDLPKGHVEEQDADNKATAIRELKEETGLNPVEFKNGFVTSINYDYIHQGEKHEKDVEFYLIEVDDSEVELSHEHKGYKWLNFDDSMKQITFDNARDVVVAAEGFLRSFA